ncbi:MAG TPA: response regulator transcription factor [Terracidiphilus sp.]|nr:response regulator transcription factor [Terracidiphilus sp.]
MVPTAHRILIVDDDVALGKFLARELSRRNFQVQVCVDGAEARAELNRPAHDLVLLDLNLPGVDGMDLLNEVRAAWPQLPIIVLTARNRTEDLVKGFEQGADDFLMKPFSLKELIARMGRLLRRRPAMAAKQGGLCVGDLALNRQEHSVRRGCRHIDLTPREFDMLEFMMGRAGKVLSRKELMESVWNAPFDASTNIVDVYLKYLRDKIDADGETKLIRTVRGVGYVLSGDGRQDG